MKLTRSLEKLQKAALLYEEIAGYCSSQTVDLSSTPFFEKVIEQFGPCLPLEKVEVDLKEVFDAGFHGKSGSLIVANKGVAIVCQSPFSSVSYITRHIACAVYHPDLGVESVNVGLVGNVFEGDVIVRAESACPPSFLFGSQRCNCSYQWASIRELAAHFNPIKLPTGMSGEVLERWIEDEAQRLKGKGLVLMHLDSQAGMGSGYSEGEFVFDMYSRALMRQLGENRTEQVFHKSIKEGYACLGVYPDSRRQAGEAGYQIPAIILDWLKVSRNLIVLSNNPYKLKALQLQGFHVKRVKSLGKIGAAGEREAKQRGEDFEHLDMDGEELTFEEEITRLKEEVDLCL